jgi:hypothetical protein
MCSSSIGIHVLSNRKSHLIVIGSMGMKYNQFEKECKSRKQARRRNLYG